MSGDDLRRRLAARESVLMPGVWDALSVRLAAQAGFSTVFLSGYCVSGTLLGLPDVGYLTQGEMAAVAARVGAASPETTVVVDADTGYGNPLNVVRTVELWEQAGASGMFLEDQVWPKRCGHMAGKQVVPREDWLAKLRAAVGRRTHLHVTARTDARAAVGLDEALERARMARDEGVDALFVEAPESVAELERIAERLARHHARRQHGRDGSDPTADAGRAGRSRLHVDRLTAHRAVRDGQGGPRRARPPAGEGLAAR